MTPELQRYYEDRLDMMSSKGWRDLMDDVKKMYDATNRLDGTTLDNLQFKKGELSIINWILSLESISEESYERLKDEDHA